ncbi:hypothetical protein PAXRUDRAFT_18559 [Paxillus rubicundulus Ve08.2h10]|uniref:Uncharacterized protein n=1 Tax=Paxillus rubicundulus Ve08.2h10 TaxID=930991 RepID=A0A0D0BXR8_9AGAM|nr:hypothetical protein PAXRUDRAFT_18559 [Paxillus rubicundulus Ve08.2h10]
MEARTLVLLKWDMPVALGWDPFMDLCFCGTPETSDQLKFSTAAADLPAVPVLKGLLNSHVKDQFAFRNAHNFLVPPPIPLQHRSQHAFGVFWHGLVARGSMSESSPTQLELQQEQRLWKSVVRTPIAVSQYTERVIVAKRQKMEDGEETPQVSEMATTTSDAYRLTKYLDIRDGMGWH